MKTKTKQLLCCFLSLLLLISVMPIMAVTANAAESMQLASGRPFTVTGGTESVDWQFSGNSLGILKSGDYIIASDGVPTNYQINIQGGINFKGTITLRNVNVHAIYAGMNIPQDAQVTLMLEGDNYFISGNVWNAGIQVNDAGAGSTGWLVIDSDCNGSLTATGGSNNAAGIGGGGGSNGGKIVIKGGRINATGGGSAPGIGNNSVNDFSTGENGNAVIVTNSIKDHSHQADWNGIIYEGNSGTVYGNVTQAGDLTVPSGKPLTIPTGASLTVPAGTSLTIPEGTELTVGAGTTLTNNGTIYVDGTLSGTVGGNIYYHLTVENGTASPTSTHDGKTYGLLGETITLTADEKVGQAASWTSSDVTISGNTFQMLPKPVTVTAVYTNAPTYTVNIPEEVTVGETVTVSASGVNVAEGYTLAVKIDDSTSFVMTSVEGAILKYAVHKDNAEGTLLNTGSNILQIAGGTKDDAASAVLAFTLASGEVEKYSGVYNGAITFHVSLTNVTP